MFDWITSFIESVGAFGVAVMMFAENVFPPIPSELVMPLAGYTASQGDGGYGALVLMLVAGTIGSLAGALLWYWIGARIGIERLKSFSRRHGRWLTLTPGEITKADRWFDRYGGHAVLIGRLIPTVRTFISVPAGMSTMSFRRFLIYTVIGTFAWTAFLGICGWVLGSNYEKVGDWMGPVSTGVIVLLVAWYLYRVVTFRHKVAKEDAREDAREGGATESA